MTAWRDSPARDPVRCGPWARAPALLRSRTRALTWARAPARAGHEVAAPGRLPRLFPSITLLRPSLRPLFSYSEGCRGVAEGKGRSGRGSAGRVPRCGGARASSPVRRWFSPTSSTAYRGRGRWRAVWRDEKGGQRISFTPGPAPLPPRSGAMTPFPMSAGAAAPPKVKRRPPFPRPRRARRRPRRCSTRRARRRTPPTHPGAPGRPHPRRRRHRHAAGAPGIGHRGPRDRHLTREHVPLADVLAG